MKQNSLETFVSNFIVSRTFKRFTNITVTFIGCTRNDAVDEVRLSFVRAVYARSCSGSFITSTVNTKGTTNRKLHVAGYDRKTIERIEQFISNAIPFALSLENRDRKKENGAMEIKREWWRGQAAFSRARFHIWTKGGFYLRSTFALLFRRRRHR